MTIKRLPDAAVSKIGSTYTIDSPTSIVKELIDNSIDAGAGSIQIEIDPTSLATITVKDDGIGIHKNEIIEFARPHTTSKIVNFNDIAEAQTLGFRGEALSCIADIAATMKVISMHEGDKVAYEWNVDRKGEASGIKIAARSPGTTIALTKLFSHVPVRESYLKKQARKTIEKIRSLIISYGLVYTEMRFSFKTLTKSQSMLTLAPCPALLPKVSMAFGKNFATNFTEGVEQCGSWKFRYVLPKPEAQKSNENGKKINIFAVDRRILSKYKPITKEICSKVSAMLPQNNFWVIDLYPPHYSYDANVEPGKDDIHFFSLEIVLDKLEAFLTTIYDTYSDDKLLAALDDREATKSSSNSHQYSYFENKPANSKLKNHVPSATENNNWVITQSQTQSRGRNQPIPEPSTKRILVPDDWKKQYCNQKSSDSSNNYYRREQSNQLKSSSAQEFPQYRTPSASSSTSQNVYPTPGKTPRNIKNQLKRSFGKPNDGIIPSKPQNKGGRTKKRRIHENLRSRQQNPAIHLTTCRELKIPVFDPLEDPSFWKDEIVKYIGDLVQLKAAAGRYDIERAEEGWWKLQF